jgi:hypothetical protein
MQFHFGSGTSGSDGGVPREAWLSKARELHRMGKIRRKMLKLEHLHFFGLVLFLIGCLLYNIYAVYWIIDPQLENPDYVYMMDVTGTAGALVFLLEAFVDMTYAWQVGWDKILSFASGLVSPPDAQCFTAGGCFQIRVRPMTSRPQSCIEQIFYGLGQTQSEVLVVEEAPSVIQLMKEDYRFWASVYFATGSILYLIQQGASIHYFDEMGPVYGWAGIAGAAVFCLDSWLQCGGWLFVDSPELEGENLRSSILSMVGLKGNRGFSATDLANREPEEIRNLREEFGLPLDSELCVPGMNCRVLFSWHWGKVDWAGWGNLSFVAGATLTLVAVAYGPEMNLWASILWTVDALFYFIDYYAMLAYLAQSTVTSRYKSYASASFRDGGRPQVNKRSYSAISDV